MKEFKRGDLVTIKAPHLAGVEAEVLWDMIDDRLVCAITGDHHPSGHSQQGGVVIMAADQLEPRTPAQPTGAWTLEIEPK